jgi:hypothetical protein
MYGSEITVILPKMPNRPKRFAFDCTEGDLACKLVCVWLANGLRLACTEGDLACKWFAFDLHGGRFGLQMVCVWLARRAIWLANGLRLTCTEGDLACKWFAFDLHCTSGRPIHATQTILGNLLRRLSPLRSQHPCGFQYTPHLLLLFRAQRPDGGAAMADGEAHERQGGLDAAGGCPQSQAQAQRV